MTNLGEGEAERISSFRATEELLVKCGGAFVELILLERSVQELAGYTARIQELFKALKVPPSLARRALIARHLSARRSLVGRRPPPRVAKLRRRQATRLPLRCLNPGSTGKATIDALFQMSPPP